MSGGFAIVVFYVTLIAAIMLHEWGHFASARRFGMRADRFFLGFGPTLWSIRRGETEYGVKALPLGGFVRIKGMSPYDERRGDIAEDLFEPERVTADRRQAAERLGVDVLDAPGLPDEVWQRVDASLEARGTPSELRSELLTEARVAAGDGGPVAARDALSEAIDRHVPRDESVGSLWHRLRRGDDGRFFADRPAWQRAVVLVAGSAMHFVLALVLLFGGYLLLPQQTGDLVARISELTEGSAAQAAGLEVGDDIVAIDGLDQASFEEYREYIRSRPGVPLEVEVARGGERLTFTVTPRPVEDPDEGTTVGQMGFLPDIETERLNPIEAGYEAVWGEGSVRGLSARTIEALGQVFGPEGIGSIFSQVNGETERDVEGGISLVGAGRAAGEGTSRFGVMFLIGLIASINVFVGIFNMLPLPPLDGGHLAVLGVERAVNAVRRSRGLPADFSVDHRTVAAVAVPVLVLIVMVSGALLWLDLTNPVQIP